MEGINQGCIRQGRLVMDAAGSRLSDAVGPEEYLQFFSGPTVFFCRGYVVNMEKGWKSNECA
jgi:hypothetical protein